MPSSKSAGAAAVKPKTLRLAPEFEDGLAMLKSVLGVSVNSMINEAVSDYIRRRSAEVEVELTGVLDKVKAHRRSDPHFALARSRLVDAEARAGRQDPVEGVVIDVEPPAARVQRKPAAGPSQTMIRNVLKHA